MNEQIHEKLKEIKQSFRLLMNGVASHSMRQKGVTYKINWGVPIPDLQKMAAEYGKDYELAIELWKEDIRECQVLATLIMPAEKMDEDLVEVWMERLRTQEMAELLAFNLLQYLDFAPALAYKWICISFVAISCLLVCLLVVWNLMSEGLMSSLIRHTQR